LVLAVYVSKLLWPECSELISLACWWVWLQAERTGWRIVQINNESCTGLLWSWIAIAIQAWSTGIQR